MTEADVEMLRALQRRAKLARQIGEIGKAGGGAGSSAGAERDVLGLVDQSMIDDSPIEVVRAFLRQAHAATSSLSSARLASLSWLPKAGFAR